MCFDFRCLILECYALNNDASDTSESDTESSGKTSNTIGCWVIIFFLTIMFSERAKRNDDAMSASTRQSIKHKKGEQGMMNIVYNN